jgi:hypothetical protein
MKRKDREDLIDEYMARHVTMKQIENQDEMFRFFIELINGKVPEVKEPIYMMNKDDLPDGIGNDVPDPRIQTMLIKEETLNVIIRILEDKDNKENAYGTIALCKTFDAMDNHDIYDDEISEKINVKKHYISNE